MIPVTRRCGGRSRTTSHDINRKVECQFLPSAPHISDNCGPKQGNQAADAARSYLVSGTVAGEHLTDHMISQSQTVSETVALERFESSRCQNSLSSCHSSGSA